jgi:hypothetical protein
VQRTGNRAAFHPEKPEMKKKKALVFIVISALVYLAWLRPRVFDEKLIFQPTPLTDDTFTNPELRKMRTEALEDTTFFTRAENTNTIRRLIDSRDLIRYCIALNFINLSIQRGEKIPEEFRNKDYLRSKLVDCLKTDLNRIYYAIEKEPYCNYCYEWGNCSDQKNLWLKIVLRFLKEFTFQKNKTLNQYWTKILDFEKNGNSNLSVNYNLSTFSKGNFYGEMFLAIATTSVEQTVKLIDTISIQSSTPTNLCPTSAPVVDGR